MNTLITGATGIIGGAIARHLVAQPDSQVRAAVRLLDVRLPNSITQIAGCELTSPAHWDEALAGVDCVVHAAARVHQMKDTARDPAVEFQRINTQATLDLAERAAKAGVKRFVFLSTLMVNGAQTTPGKPFTADDLPNPQSPYARSKWEAENGLKEIAARTGMEVVIIRPPMVIAPNAKGNFLTLTNAIRRGIPLPFGAVKNQRSFVGIDNLVSLIATCTSHPNAANEIFLASDGQDISTGELVAFIADGLHRKSIQWPVPGHGMKWVAHLMGREDLAVRLFGSLQADIQKTKALLDWQPPFSVQEGISRAVTADAAKSSIIQRGEAGKASHGRVGGF